MSAYLVVEFSVKDQEKLRLYGAMAGDTLTSFDGKVLAKGPVEVLHGGATHQSKVLIEFPSRESALQWYHSKAYQNIAPIRDQGMDSRFHIVE